MKTLIISLLVCCSIFADGYYGDSFISFGPMFHWNIGEKTKFSVAFEASYWHISDIGNFIDELPYGADIGFEVDVKDGTKRIYSELQTGYYLGGISIGPGLEFKNGKSTPFYQGSIWFGLIGYADFRIRKVENEMVYAPGFMLKCPIPLDEHLF